MASETVPQQRGGLSTLANIVGILMGIAFIVAVVVLVAIQTGYYTPPPLIVATPAPTARPTSAPVATRAPAVQQQPQQAAPTVAPAVQADPAAPLPVPAPVPVETVDDAPAELRGAGGPYTRGTICFDEWYYVDGVRSNTRCVGGGGD